MIRKMPSRQVHLDFHTSPSIPGVGEQFDKAQFQAALQEGNINSITIFAKCHHGYCYYPTQVGTQHPTMKPGFDLTGAMADAAHEIGVAAPIYITAGWSALDAEAHPDWCMRDKEGNILATNIDPEASPDDPRPECSWYNLCMTGDYAQHIYDLTEEISNRYPVLDGLFYDIMFQKDVCYCPNCLKGMKEEGLNPDKIEDAREYYYRAHRRFMAECGRILHKKHPEATIFFNGLRREYYPGDSVTHFEMEDLPTAWGGYNKMPANASYIRHFGRDYLGMTGKFHTAWGEFGGYKNPEALKMEALMMAMNGAKCSVGDQLPPSGKMDMETYRIIGHAYRALEKIEPWAYPARSTATLGVYQGSGLSNEGLHEMLLESHIDFESVLPGDDLSVYKALLLPDAITISREEAARINAFIAQGGAVLFSGRSALTDGEFLLDAGVKYAGEANYKIDYLCPTEEMKLPFGNAPFLCYESALRTKVTDGEVLARIYEPWFDRTYSRYCSHKNTPYRDEPASHPAVVRKGRVVYLAHPMCKLYKQNGAQLFREVLIRALLSVYEPTYRVSLPSAGRTRLTWQEDEGRYVFHAAYVSPIQRGNVSVIEDIPPMYQVTVDAAIDLPVSRVLLVPAGDAIPFEQQNGRLRFTIPCVNGYQVVEIRVK